jgi:hypothetical protein
MKSIKKTLMVALCALSLAACSKQGEITPAEETVKVKPRKNDKSGGQFRRFYDRGGNDYGCEAVVENCYPDDMILTGKPNRLTSALSTIESGVNLDIQSYFVANKASLTNDFGSYAVTGVISGDLTASLRGTSTDTNVFVLFNNTSTQIIEEVYPIVQN